MEKKHLGNLVECLRMNICEKLFLIWASGLGEDVVKRKCLRKMEEAPRRPDKNLQVS